METQVLIAIIGVVATVLTGIGGAVWKTLSWLGQRIDPLFESAGGAIADHRKLVNTLQKNAESDGATLQHIASVQSEHGETLAVHGETLQEIHAVVVKKPGVHKGAT